jgi:hypothetical protein
MAFQHIGVIEELLVGKQPIRYNRHRNQLFLDMDWNTLNVGEYIVVEAYQVVDPTEFTEVWKDRWLLKYATALIKRQWGINLKKYDGMALPGGITFSGQKMYEEAIEEIAEMERDMITSYSLPLNDMYG